MRACEILGGVATRDKSQNGNVARSSQAQTEQQRRAMFSLFVCDFLKELEQCYLLGATPLLFIICMFYNLICNRFVNVLNANSPTLLFSNY